MHAVITAGGAPKPGEMLYEATQGRHKALLPIHGKPMIQWVIDALDGAPSIQRIVVVGLPQDTGLSSGHPLSLLPDRGDLMQNLRCGVDAIRDTEPGVKQLLAISSDIPTITPEMVEWMIKQVEASDHDLYYNVIERKTMESRFAGSRRTYLHLKDMEVCGGDLNAVKASAVSDENPMYKRLIAARKSPLRQALLLGIDTLILLLLHRLDLSQLAEKASRRLGIRGRVITCPYAEVGMDVDKPFQLEIVRNHLGRQVSP